VEGIYSVSLTICDGDESDTYIHNNLVNVQNPINANFSANLLTGNPPLEVQFTDLSESGIEYVYNTRSRLRDITYWEWDFDNDGNIDSFEQNPTFIYTEAGSYDVSLTVGDEYNSDSLTQSDFIVVTETDADNEILTIQRKLINNHPNPFNPITTIEFNIKENETGDLKIYNVKGQILETKQFESGNQSYVWNAEKQTSGIYFYQLQTENFSQVKKMIMIK
jgi:PKD repeat protein